VYSIAALQLAVTLGWMAYAHFQPVLLERFGLSELTGLLSLYLGLVGATLAPLIGGAGDRLARRSGRRMPLVVAGGLLAGATFVGVALTLVASPDGTLRWLLLGLVLVWIAAMTVLQAPALALLPATASPPRWPAAVSPMVVATVLPAALWPLVQRVLDGLGGPLVYLAGAALVLGATVLVRRELDTEPPAPVTAARIAPPLPLVVFGLGVLSAFITRLASDVVPTVLAMRVGTPASMAAVTLGASTLLAPSLGAVGVTLGSRRGVVTSALVALACGALAPIAGSLGSAAAIAVALGAALALHLDCALPFSLEALPRERAGLSAGLYLGGAFAGSQLAPLVPWLGIPSGAG